MKPTTATAKTKARDIIPGWPRSKSTMAMWPHAWSRFYVWSTGDEFRLKTEEALESAYRAGQNGVVDNYRAFVRKTYNVL